jgi:hypothetical protein
MFDQEAVGAERFLRVETAIRDLVLEKEGKAGHRRLHSRFVAVLGSDRTDRTGEKRLIGPMNL